MIYNVINKVDSKHMNVCSFQFIETDYFYEVKYLTNYSLVYADNLTHKYFPGARMKKDTTEKVIFH